MRVLSPAYSNEVRTSLSRKIRLNINSRYIPEDFFPSSISSSPKRRKSSLLPPDPSVNPKSPSKQPSQKAMDSLVEQTQKLEMLRKRLIKIKQVRKNCDIQSQQKPESRKKSSSKSKLVTNIQFKKSGNDSESKRKSRRRINSKNFMAYMEKMKNLTNIDLKFKEDQFQYPTIIPNNAFQKKTPQQLDTDDSPKFKLQRPKSQLNSRQRLRSSNKMVQARKQIALSCKPMKIRLKQQQSLPKSKHHSKKQNQRYNKFMDIQLNQEGLLTFYGKPAKGSYDAKKYSARTSLPRLQK